MDFKFLLQSIFTLEIRAIAVDFSESVTECQALNLSQKPQLNPLFGDSENFVWEAVSLYIRPSLPDNQRLWVIEDVSLEVSHSILQVYGSGYTAIENLILIGW